MTEQQGGNVSAEMDLPKDESRSISKEVQPFYFNEQQVRAVLDEVGETWFIGKDVAESLGYRDTDQAIRKHCKSPKIFKPVDLPGLVSGPRGMTFIPERDVYRLAMKSHLPEAEAFEEWVVGEVLPTIRKTGSYHASMPDFNNPAEAARAWAKAARDWASEYEQRLIAEKTKAHIGDKSQATAMATASREARRAQQLEDQLGVSENWKQAKAIPWLKNYFNLNSRLNGKQNAVFIQIGKALSAMCEELDVVPKEIPDSAYGSIKAYPMEVIERFQEKLDREPSLLAKYRVASQTA